MGTGCNPNKNISKCLDSDKLPSDCVINSGVVDTSLSICIGDSLTEVLQVIIDKIKNSTTDGANVTLNTLVLDVCNDIKNIVGSQPKTVLNVIQALVQYSCVLKTRIDALNTTIVGNLGSGTINFKCVTSPAQFSFTSAIQAVIDTLCNLVTQVNEIVNNAGSTTIIDNRINQALNTLLKSIGGNGLIKTINPTTQQTNYTITGFPPPYSMIPYAGPLSNFDASGKGLANTPCDGWYICNGNNGTLDMRGFVPVGAIKGVPGGSVESIVDPASDASMNYSIGDIGGATKRLLVDANIPPHSHPVIDNGHSHKYLKPRAVTNSDDGGIADYVAVEDGFTSIEKSNITIGNSSGGGQPIDIRQPYRAVLYITRFN